MKTILLITVSLLFACISHAQTYKFDMTKTKTDNGFFTIPDVPDGNYRVRVKLGSATAKGSTTVRGESRRLFLENIPTRKGQFVEKTFTINKRNTRINDTESVRIKPREKKKFNWDNHLTFEFTGDAPQVAELEVTRVDDVPTIFLCGNSTVVDQDNEPWASWGQMIPRFFNEKVCFANYAESGESANTFIAAGRLKKILTQIKPGDYVFVEFGHNDQKQKGPDKGPYKSFTKSLRQFVEGARAHQAQIVFVTPTQRRSFGDDGKIRDTHGEFPNAMRALAKEENIPVIELNEMTRTFYEAMGPEASKQAFVHYPANTWPHQTKELADNTHFNPYGAYEIAKCVIEGMKANKLPLVEYLRPGYKGFNPARPDKLSKFHWTPSPFSEVEKPDGN